MLNGTLLIGHHQRRGSNGEFRAIDACTGQTMEPGFGGATLDDLDDACELADEAFDFYQSTSPEERAGFLERIAENIFGLGGELVERCVAETGLLRARVEGERGRTVGQLRLFASVLRGGEFLDARIDLALPGRTPQPRPDLRLRNVGIGPVAVFGASNFPLAFSVAGGDTASAFAAGCPVIVKAHSAHPGTSELVGRAIQEAIKQCELPEGTFSLLFDTGRTISQALVADRRIKAVGFTGSRSAGTAFMKIAAERPEPIPVYAEMSSVNPVVVFPHALASRGGEIAQQFVSALTLGAGQFCTNPGLIVLVDGRGYDDFIQAARNTLEMVPAATMLTPGIHKSFCVSVDKLRGQHGISVVAEGRAAGELQGRAILFETRASNFLSNSNLHEEVFGASSLVVRCSDADELREVIRKVEGQLTIALHVDEADFDMARNFVPLIERKAGRLIVNGFGTGVEVSHAMVHGGPFPATSDVRTSSVGSIAINRFLRPVSYQSFPQELLPLVLADNNPHGVPRRIDPAKSGGTE